ncbi:hypothetical protein BDY24DRAFT_403371, partial [Mrakia frigida]|uniref:uncharacterized protein n=1 Tax=Mrakia frigida TaxID=29902 RepID=UPI003FCBFD95
MVSFSLPPRPILYVLPISFLSLVLLIYTFSSSSSSLSSSPTNLRPSIHSLSSSTSSSFTPSHLTTYFITASSRGIGLEIVSQLARDQNARVVAAARDPEGSPALMKLVKGEEFQGRIKTVTLDVTSQQSIEDMLVQVEKIDFIRDQGINVLLHVAGLMSGGFGLASQITPQDLHLDTVVNFHAPILLTQALFPLLSRPPPSPSTLRKIFVLSSILGSMDSFDEMKGYSAAYSATKVAVDMWVRKLAWELDHAEEGSERRNEGGWVVGSLHPGFVRTDMTSGRGEINVQESANGVLKTLAAVKEENTGRFYDWEGREMGW